MVVEQKADELFQTSLEKKISRNPKFFLNYATFLFDTMASPERGRMLLPRALQSLPPHAHIEVTSRFAQLEYRSPNGDMERGRTVFEGLLSSFPKRIDLWNVLLDLEIKGGGSEQVRRLFERVLGPSAMITYGKKGKSGEVLDDDKKRLKPKQARFFFGKWLTFEEKLNDMGGGNGKILEEVRTRAADYINLLAEE
jgi:rRNA biogenesis protein RRP5